MTRADWLCLVLLGALALGIGLGGAASVPLDTHEADVAQTAQTMLASHDGLVSRVNDAPRLQKPPLSYWASAATAMVAGHDHVSELDARWPSIVAGLLLAWLVFGVVRVERGRAVGLLAGLIAITSLGFFRYGHSARPDMLYGLLAFAMFAAYVVATRSRGRRQFWAALAIWLAFGLHILTKGPQFGVVILLGAALHAAFTAPAWGTVWRRFRPELGVPLLALITLPWWLVVYQTMGPQLVDSQLSGALPGLSPSRLLHAFYWWHAPGEWAPWLVLIGPALAVAWRQRQGMPGLLLLIILLAIAVFSLGSPYRAIYMVPSVGLAAVWLALGAEWLWQSRSRWAWFGFALQSGLLAVIAVGGWIWLLWQVPTQPSMLIGAGVLVAALLGITAWELYRARQRPQQARWFVLVLLGTAVGVALMPAGRVPAVWNATRYYQHDLTGDMAPYRTRPIAVLVPQSPAVFVYYLQRPMHVAQDVAAACHWAAAQPTTAKPVLLYNPSQSQSVERVFPNLRPLLQSPGSHRSSVIVAEIDSRAACQGS